MSAKKKGWRGYNFSRPIDGNSIPQRVQNLVIRNYCQQFGLEYLLSATEYEMENSYMILSTLYEELGTIEGIVFYSVHMLPRDASERKKIYENILGRGGSVRFALEELNISNSSDIPALEDIMVCKELMGSSPTVDDLKKAGRT
jgi:sporadic carbohydrate cluster protein (TIGR04323 family)